MQQPRILLVVGGGIAAYKSCELVRLIRKGGGDVTCVLTEGGAQFVTPMSLAALSGNQVHTSLWDLRNEAEIGHIQLSRDADLVVVCPATANLLAKMAAGICDDLATTLILATDKPVLAVPAMNVRMWQHAATQRNLTMLRQAGVHVMQPDEGPMACGEFGPGRLPDPEMVWLEIADLLGVDPGDAGPRDVADYLQALEPEEEPEPEREKTAIGGLAGLLASIIPRSTARRIEEKEVTYREEESADEPIQPPLPDDFELPEKGELPPPDLVSGPLLAPKGQAKAVPRADPYSLDGGAASPAFDPLEGQPEFDADPEHRPLYGRHVLVTAGPTHEPIDPVRYIANRSSGKQGFAIAAAAAAAGARVTLISGPVTLDTPPGVDRIDVESAEEMAAAVKSALPADAAVMVAAVADWRTRDYAAEKMKKRGSAPPALLLTENPDILAIVASSPDRPRLVVGFAAETQDVVENAKAKRKRKAVDWILANDVSGDVMGGSDNTVHLVSEDRVEDWEPMSKQEVARHLVERMAEKLND
ncbi:phosphopantothenoylcysteine decarboxylase/phosphopantothenate--cysteine ligase [Altererythrobacter atlanticus]|uniref:Coenzyme A biosynthesis bifunctional protein CoaBC n=1 Tax=Croceibacterium atlanticum TaxID=1267766 RepID=A0A0F7KSW1_9SPHN|nr:bifunctional phosphopantothenoylcysteine decarboxylase/phosphopantothenate synthase [Croceibacterium atlanticum]AKH42679.1 Coenzyme A biosynthesis bifunctional protein CoaBC [Croceibacterium atlanticum]MBB5731456.1 phosphopantothenoylcysteine decarboxylase/phosphopantothenate--cysteine ligase [Croceibacterium atlanticum]